MNKPHILITNDDGIHAEGIEHLVEIIKDNYIITIVAPEFPQSGKSHSITSNRGLKIEKMTKFNRHKSYAVNGTPVDCVKVALQCIMENKPDLIISGINNGTNTGNSAFYSGTVGAALEGSFFNIPSIAFSLCNNKQANNFRKADKQIIEIIEKTLETYKKTQICLNVNIPNTEIKGIKICRQTKGAWKEEFKKTTNEKGETEFWLRGNYHNEEPHATDTDEWAVNNKHIAIVPLTQDLTNKKILKEIIQYN